MTDHGVVIAGGGPTGLMLAGELGVAKIDVAIVERRASQDLPGSRAGGLHARTIEVLDQRGIAERILAAWVGELPVTFYRGREVTGFAQDDAGVDIALSDGQRLRAEYLVGCDGGRSLIRKAAGIDFPGWDPTTSALLAEVEMSEEPQLGIRRTPSGMHALGRREYEIRDGKIIYKDVGPVGVMVTEEHVGSTNEPTLGDLSRALIAVCGTDYGIHSPIWISRFTDMTRQAATYRDRRVLLAGDAAHVHSPVGGQ